MLRPPIRISRSGGETCPHPSSSGRLGDFASPPWLAGISLIRPLMPVAGVVPPRAESQRHSAMRTMRSDRESSRGECAMLPMAIQTSNGACEFS